MKKRKIFKKITLAGLAACMFCLPILAGCAPAEMLPENPSPGQNFDLGLNPETDPVVFTTESGLEIKKSNAKYSSTTTLITDEGFSYTQDLRDFYYFTMGTFSGTIYDLKTQTSTYTVSNEPVNWLIIGRGEMPVADSTPAGSAIQGDAGKQEIAMGSSIYENLNLSAVPENSDIPKGCFLVLSEKLLGQMYLNSAGAINYGYGHGAESETSSRISGNGLYGDRYRYKSDASTSTAGTQTWNNKTDGSLYSYINGLFSKNTSGTILSNSLGFTQAQADLIVPQQLYTFYSNGAGHPLAETPSTDGGTYYTMFPLARRAASSSTKQNFCVEDYFKSDSQRVGALIGSNIDYYWYLRSGSAGLSGLGSFIFSTGAITNGWWGNNSLGVRPAMVMKLS